MSEDQPTKMMLVMRKAPHGTIYSYEGLEYVQIASAYDTEISMAFIGDGVYALKKDQDTSEIGIKGFIKTYRTLPDLDVEKLYVDKRSMEERGLTPDDFPVDVIVTESAELNRLMGEQHALFPF